MQFVQHLMNGGMIIALPNFRFFIFPLPVLIFLISTSAATQCVRLLSDIVSAGFFSRILYSLFRILFIIWLLETLVALKTLLKTSGFLMRFFFCIRFFVVIF